jgi:hypothetical protein
VQPYPTAVYFAGACIAILRHGASIRPTDSLCAQCGSAGRRGGAVRQRGACEFSCPYDACAKRYVYRIRNSRCRPGWIALLSAMSASTGCWCDVAAAAFLIGRHDFYSFMAAGSTAKTTSVPCTTSDLPGSEGSVIAIHVTGDGFLYNMFESCPVLCCMPDWVKSCGGHIR